MKDQPDKQDVLVVKEHFRKFYICNNCGTNCYFCVTNTFKSLPLPIYCPYDEGKPNWKPLFE